MMFNDEVEDPCAEPTCLCFEAAPEFKANFAQVNLVKAITRIFFLIPSLFVKVNQ